MLHKYVFNHFGAPLSLLSDNAGEFKSGEWKDLLKASGIKQHLGTPWNPRSQGHVERLNATILQLLRSIIVEYAENWDYILPYAQNSYNCAFHTAIDNTPFFFRFGKDFPLDLEAVSPKHKYEDTIEGRRHQLYAQCLEMARNAIYQTQKRRQGRLNVHRSCTAHIGDIVYYQAHYQNEPDHKILQKFYGPVRIMN